jgi:hypothetical protein
MKELFIAPVTELRGKHVLLEEREYQILLLKSKLKFTKRAPARSICCCSRVGRSEVAIYFSAARKT